MNHSINYSGFIDLAMEASSIVSNAAKNHDTETYKPALSMQLDEDNQITAKTWGSIRHPLQSD